MFLKLRTRLNAEKAIVLAENIKELHVELILLINRSNIIIAIRENYK